MTLIDNNCNSNTPFPFIDFYVLCNFPYTILIIIRMYTVKWVRFKGGSSRSVSGLEWRRLLAIVWQCRTETLIFSIFNCLLKWVGCCVETFDVSMFQMKWMPVSERVGNVIVYCITVQCTASEWREREKEKRSLFCNWNKSSNKLFRVHWPAMN